MAPHIMSKTVMPVTELCSPPDERAWRAHSFVLVSTSSTLACR
jgi:hypothetical protein